MSGFLSIAISVISGFLIIGAILVILNDNQDSGRKIAWILTIGILPVVGLGFSRSATGNFSKPLKAGQAAAQKNCCSEMLRNRTSGRNTATLAVC